jgi:hypothetical protein
MPMSSEMNTVASMLVVYKARIISWDSAHKFSVIFCVILNMIEGWPSIEMRTNI